MSAQLKKRLKNRIAKALNEKARVRIGKNGVTDAIITEIENQLAIHGLIKVRFLNNFISDDLDEDIKIIVKKTNSQLVDKRGKAILLYKAMKE
jgi:RNA-binding protein